MIEKLERSPSFYPSLMAAVKASTWNGNRHGFIKLKFRWDDFIISAAGCADKNFSGYRVFGALDVIRNVARAKGFFPGGHLDVIFPAISLSSGFFFCKGYVVVSDGFVVRKEGEIGREE